LFGALGWPSGVLDIASWATRAGLADSVVFQLQPGFAFSLDPEDRHYLGKGQVDPEITESFMRRGRRLSSDARVAQIGSGLWEIRDQPRGWTYRVTDKGDAMDVTILENCDTRRYETVIRRFGERASRTGQFFEQNGAPSTLLVDALMAVGGQFLVELIRFAPHVVGFRLEGDGFEHIKRCVRAARLFSDAEIVLGGPTVTSHPREVLEESGADYVFAGEAEETFNQFLRFAAERNSKDRQPEIPGLAFRHGGRAYLNTLPADGYERTVLDRDRSACGRNLHCVKNLVRPIADGHVLTANRLDWSCLRGFEQEFDSLFFTGGRGCPGACTFCAKLHGQEVRVKSAGQLLDEIEAADCLIADGKIRVTQWPLFQHVEDLALRNKVVRWAAVYDEDFFLHRRRAIEFFRLWDRTALKDRYRISLQTNPCSMLTASGEPQPDLIEWIDRLKPMVQLGAESFHPEVLRRWHKRHTVRQLDTVLDALDTTRQDYTVFQLLTDFDTRPDEFIENLRLLILNALKHRRMRIASSPYTIPLYESDTRRLLEYRDFLTPDRVGHFTDYQRPQPGWMDPLTADLADLADSELQWTLQPEKRDGALLSAMEVILERIRREERSAEGRGKAHSRAIREQAERALDDVREMRYREIG
jgi:hypothetical protein